MANVGRLNGSTPIPDMLAWEEAQDPVGRRALYHRGHRAVALAMQGRIDAARSVMAELREDGEDRGLMRNVRTIGVMDGTVVELLAGDPATAVELGERGCLQLEENGDSGSLSTALVYVAEALYRLGRLDEALSRADRAAQLGATDDVVTQMGWRQVAAKVMARRGEAGKAEQLARQAVAQGGESVDMLDARADSYANLAEVLELTGQPEAAVEPLRQAAELYERKGNLVSLRRVRERLSRLGAAATG